MGEDEGVARRGPGRKPRFTATELEARTLSSAIDALIEQGVTGGVDAIRIEKVIVNAAVPRAATYTLWESRGSGSPQENLRRAAVLEVIRNMPSGNADRTAAYAAEEMAANAERLASPDPVVRSEQRSELIRKVAGFNFELLQDQRWRVYKALTSSIGSLADPDLRAAVAAGEEDLLDAYGGLFEQWAELLGLRLRDGLTLRHFTMSAYALNEGLSNRVGESFGDQRVELDRKEWTVLAIGFEALVDRYFTD